MEYCIQVCFPMIYQMSELYLFITAALDGRVNKSVQMTLCWMTDWT